MKAKHVIGALALVGVGAGLWWLLRPETAQERTASQHHGLTDEEWAAGEYYTPEQEATGTAAKKAYSRELALKESGALMAQA
jgi:hypothetical protein